MLMAKEGVLKEICDTLKGEYGHTAPGHPTDVAYCRINRGATTISEEGDHPDQLVIRDARVFVNSHSISIDPESKTVWVEDLGKGTIDEDGMVDLTSGRY